MFKENKAMIFLVIIAMALLIFKMNSEPKTVNIDKVETIEKPVGVSDLKVEKEGNTRKVIVTVEGNDIEQAKEQAQELLDTIEREEGTVFMFEVVDKDNKVILMGLSLMGSNKIDWN